jgi:hypothetical protein
MNDTNPNGEFLAKLNAEHKAFINDLRGKPVDEIINASYKKVVFDEIVAAFENADYTERDYAAFNEQDGLLDAIYMEWLDSDTADFEELRTVIDSYFERYEGYKVEHYYDDGADERDAILRREPENTAPGNDAPNKLLPANKPHPTPEKPQSAFDKYSRRKDNDH